MCRVLYVGSEPTLADLASRIIKKYGYDVSYITSLAEKICFKPDLILFDCDMSPAFGLEKYKSIITRFSDAAILWISSSENDEVQALEAGADDWVKKPLKMDVLLARMKKLVKNL